MLILIILIFAVIGIIQIPKLVKKKHWRDLIIYSAFLICAFALHLLYFFNVDIPNPVAGIMELLNRTGLHY